MNEELIGRRVKVRLRNENGRAEPCPHIRVWVSCEEDGYVGQCVRCAAWGPKRESYEEAKPAFEEVWGTKA